MNDKEKAELALDLEELKNLEKTVQRKKNKVLLQNQISSIEMKLQLPSSVVPKTLAEYAIAAKNDTTTTTTTTTALDVQTITNYSFDQEDEDVTLFINIVPESIVKFESTDISFDLLVKGADGKLYRLAVANLAGKINPKKSLAKIPSSKQRVIVVLAKAETKHWNSIIKKKEDAKNEKAFDDDLNAKDPQKGMMDLMKKLYDEGDDEVCQQI